MSEERTAEATDEPGGSRRDLLSKAGVAAAVAAVAGVAASQTTDAANNDPMLLGNPHTATGTTRISGGGGFMVTDGTSTLAKDASILGLASADDHVGVRGEASGSAGWGVYGISSGDKGRAVYGNNNGSDGFGVYGLTSAAGTTSAGVFGRNTGGGHGVRGSSNGTGAGVRGEHSESDGIGVYGHHSSASKGGTGVLGAASIGTGVTGRGSSYDLLASRSGKIGLNAVGTTGATATGTVGTLARDADGNLWYCYATDKWEQISGIVPDAIAPQFTPITPIRAYDSRIGAIPESGAFVANTSKVISIKDGRDQTTGAVDAADAVPAGAKAVAFNVTATNTTAGSFLAVVPGDVASSAVSSLNWSSGGISIANAGIVGVDGSLQVRIIAGPVGTFDAIIDITGYFI